MDNNHFCDFCKIDKFNSETQEYQSIPFECYGSAKYIAHINTKKHILNTVISKNLTDDLVVKCKHCSVIYTKEQYKLHQQRNSLFWSMRYKYTQSSCNNFTYEGKRFINIPTLNDYMEHSTKYKRQRYEKNKIFEAAAQIIENKDKWEKELHAARLRNAEKQRATFAVKKAKEELKEQEKKLKKTQKPKSKKTTAEILADEVVGEPNIKMKIKPILDERYGKDAWLETPLEKERRERDDCNIPPIIDADDLCLDCGYTQNFIIEYPIEKLKRYSINTCRCSDSESE
tara:strand:- start:13 stop:870 length:858 start_codon:yes stop_codon:yes gene_type:complete